MLSDIEINKNSNKIELEKLIKKYNIKKEELFLYGKYMAKLEPSIFDRLNQKKDQNLVLVTATTPTPSGEGKSTITIGLVDALNKLGYLTIGAIREPSLGPVFGVKGGAAGGGYAQVTPMDSFNLHFTGDMHAITSANNLISACIDNSLYFNNPLNLDPNNIVWKRCIDLNDRSLRKVHVGLHLPAEKPRYDNFNITAASEIMAVLCLATSLTNLRERLNNLTIGYTYTNEPITVKDLKIVGSLLVLLKEAFKPNLIQTLENNLIIAHGGPFANIAHGCNSIQATKLALKLAKYTITEAGFASDLGAEKFLDIKCREANINPSLVIIVTTIKSLKYHGGKELKDLKEEDLKCLKKGFSNLQRHIDIMKKFKLNYIVCLNKFYTDTLKEINLLKNYCEENQVKMAVSESFSKGGDGGIDLAKLVVDTAKKTKVKYTYNLTDKIEDKIKKIAKNIYGARQVIFSEEAKRYIDYLNSSIYKDFYVCIAKTQNSLSDDPNALGAPTNFNIYVKEIRVCSGAKFIVVIAGTINTMPGLSQKPLATIIELDEEGNIHNLS